MYGLTSDIQEEIQNPREVRMLEEIFHMQTAYPPINYIP